MRFYARNVYENRKMCGQKLGCTLRLFVPQFFMEQSGLTERLHFFSDVRLLITNH